MENNQVTAIKTILVPINKTGKNYIPFNEELKNRVIRYVDMVMPDALPQSSAAVFTAFDYATLSLSDYNGNAYVGYNLPLQRLNPVYHLGVRIAIDKKLSFQNSYIEVTSPVVSTSYAVMVVYYDMPEYAQVNTTNDLALESFDVPIKSAIFKNLMPDNRTLVNKRFKQIAIPELVTITPSFSECGNDKAFKVAYMTLIKDNYLILDNVPLLLFKEPYYLQSINFRNITFDFINSYITLGGDGTNSDAIELVGKSIFINVLYENN